MPDKQASQPEEQASDTGQILVDHWLELGDDLREALEVDPDDEGGYSSEVILEAAVGLLDDACSWEIVGPCVFKATNGKYYVGTVEFSIREANPDYINDLIHEVKER